MLYRDSQNILIFHLVIGDVQDTVYLPLSLSPILRPYQDAFNREGKVNNNL